MERSGGILQSFQSLSISSTILDFGPEFARNKTPEEFVAAVDRYLKLHTSDNLYKFRLYFFPFDMFLDHIEHWVEFAVSKGVEELELDLSMGLDPNSGEFYNEAHLFRLPSCLFNCKSLTNLSLSHCDFPPVWCFHLKRKRTFRRMNKKQNMDQIQPLNSPFELKTFEPNRPFSPPRDFTGFDRLHSLSLAHVTITDDVLQWVLASCPLLNSLSLKSCNSLNSVKISAQYLLLQKLVIVNCWYAREIEICAPNLRTLIYSGELAFSETPINVPSLVDAFVSSIGAESSEPYHDYIRLLYDLSHVEILTVCCATLWRVEIYKEIDVERLPILLHNLRELQLLMTSICIEDLACMYTFFQLCPSPFIEKLFIQLPTIPEHPGHYCCVIRTVEEPLGVLFNHLKMIKLNNFIGCATEMRLVKFLLERAVVLETLVLVAPRKPDLKGSMDHDTVPEGNSVDMVELMTLREQLALLPKASTAANVVLCEYLEDDKSFNPTHTEYYWDFS